MWKRRWHVKQQHNTITSRWVLLSASYSLLFLSGCGVTPYALDKGHHLLKPETVKSELKVDEMGSLPFSDSLPSDYPVASTSSSEAVKHEKEAMVPLLSMNVRRVPVRDLLFTLARDAKINIDVHPQVTGLVSLNVYQQTLPQVLARLQRQIPMRIERDQGTFVVLPDRPFMKNYAIDYVNVSRVLKSDVSLSTAIATVGGSVSQNGLGGTQGNSSSTKLSNSSEHQLWKSLVENVKDILKEEAPVSFSGAPALASAITEMPSAVINTETMVPPLVGQSATGRSGESTQGLDDVALGTPPSKNKKTKALVPPKMPIPPVSIPAERQDRSGQVIANPETGVMAVWGTARQHARVKKFLDQVMQQAQRQVLIEATIVEVVLADDFQMGIDWSRLTQGTGLGSGLSFVQKRALDSTPFATLTYRDNKHDLSTTLTMLETFGRTRVLSSPKIIALNNQTALLKVVDERVYFSTQVKVTEATTTTPEKRDYTSEIKTVPVGVVMNVTPQISQDNQVSLNIRPTISRITSFKADPVPQLLGSDLQNLVPEIQVRELESVLKVADGQVVILGGLMQDSLQQNRESVPMLGRMPLVGDLFKQKKENGGKSELVIFLRPTIMHAQSEASSYGTQWLPDERFMESDAMKEPLFPKSVK